MNELLIVLIFLIFIFCLNKDKIENFSQIMLPNYTPSIYTGKQSLDKPEVTVDSSRKPSYIEDVKQPPYSRFTAGKDTVSDSPEEIKDIRQRLEDLVGELDLLKSIDLDVSGYDYKGICGSRDKMVSGITDETKYPTVPLTSPEDRQLLQELVYNYPIHESCLWGIDLHAMVGDQQGTSCGVCGDQPNQQHYDDLITSSESSTQMKKQYIKECTGFNIDDDRIGEPNHDWTSSTDNQFAAIPCRKFCCENFLFPMEEGNPYNEMYKEYLRKISDEGELNLLDLDSRISYQNAHF